MQIVAMPVGRLEANCYIAVSEKKNAAVIDPGAEAGRIFRYLSANGLTAKKILLTHGHIDHVGAVKEIKDATGAEVCIHSADAQMLCSAVRNLAAFMGESYQPTEADRFLEEGDTVTLDELTFEVLHTPGHTPGSVSYLAEKTLFSGDTLFAGSIGRTDFPGGDAEQMNVSLRRLSALPGDYTVLSGHGERSSLAWERNHNPYLRTAVSDEERK